MYLYKAKIIHNNIVYLFYSPDKQNLNHGDIVKVETKHGIDLAFFIGLEETVSEEELHKRIQKQTIKPISDEEEIPESLIENGITGDPELDFKKLSFLAQKEAQIVTTETKKSIKIEGKFLGAATFDDIKLYNKNKKREEEAFEIFKQKIKEHGLPMKPISVHFFLDDKKILFNFIADGRIDFRELVRSLAAVFKKRIELHQIGVRDEARILDGIGICGQPLCCKRFLNILNPISIKMAKVQNAPLNTMKISGYCGRLLCCLAYEYEFYEEAKKDLPEEGAKIIYNNSEYILYEINVIKNYIKLKDQMNKYLIFNIKPFKTQKIDEETYKLIEAQIKDKIKKQ